jgi:phosphatidylglycerophosphate synthase
MASGFGARFDMETDALLIMVLAVLAWQFGKAGVWVLASGLLRYAFVAASLALPWLRRPLPASHRRKVVAVVQVIALIFVVAPFISAAAAAAIAAVGLFALTLSFLVDIVWLFQHSVQSRAAASAP